jgi:hypothetical protein
MPPCGLTTLVLLAVAVAVALVAILDNVQLRHREQAGFISQDVEEMNESEGQPALIRGANKISSAMDPLTAWPR